MAMPAVGGTAVAMHVIALPLPAVRAACRPTEEQLANFGRPDFTIYNAGGQGAVSHGVGSALDCPSSRVLIATLPRALAPLGMRWDCVPRRC